MDLSARDTYRGQPALCPTCGTLMEEIDVGDALVDVCRACRGLWLDWLDGDPRHLAHRTEETLAEQRPSLAGAADDRATLESAGVVGVVHGCPRCRGALTAEDYEMRPASPAEPAASPPLPAAPAVSVEVHRCGSCFGLFLTRASAERAVSLEVYELPPSDAPDALPWQKILAVLRRILGLG